MAATSLQEAMEELDVARYLGDHKRVAVAKAALILAKAALPGPCEPLSDTEAFIKWRNARIQA